MSTNNIMVAKRRKSKGGFNREPNFPLGLIKTLAKSDATVTIRKKALETAQKDFGWGVDDIKSAIKKLHKKDFCKTENDYYDSSIKIDYYKSYGLNGENVYTHFTIDKDSDGNKILRIQSFKRI